MMFVKEVFIILVVIGYHYAAYTEEEAEGIFYPNDIESEFVTACYGEYGCFYTGPPFYDPVYRPVSVPPANDTVTKTFLFTPENKNEPYELIATEESFNNSNFNPAYFTKIIVHGFDRQNLSDFYDMKDALLNLDNFNVIVVDWTHDNQFPIWQAVANARITAAKLAQLLQFILDKTGMDPKYYHLIGHSLGAHLSGWVGERVSGIWRITGLDPAGPYFQNASDEVALDISDAIFVDAMHCNAGSNITEGLGLLADFAHLDFYPNGGNSQPGCTSDDDLISNANTVLVSNICSHNRCVNLYTASITSKKKCRFYARHAVNYEYFLAADYTKEFNEGVYNDFNEMAFLARPYMGFYANNSRYYLRTSGEFPYCLDNGYEV